MMNYSIRPSGMVACWLLVACAAVAPQAFAEPGSVASAADPHAHHHPAMHQAAGMHDAPRSTSSYALPNVKLVRDDGAEISLPVEIDDGRPVFMTFIYTACTTICPVASQTFSQLQRALGPELSKVHLVSISIDPEQDTPVRLRQYANRFGAGPSWQHYTGTVDASIAVQRAFDVYRGDKMNHNPVTFVRAAPGRPWLRIDGFATARELLQQYHRLVAG